MKQTHQKIEPEDDLAPKYDYQLAWKTEEYVRQHHRFAVNKHQALENC